MGPVIVGFELVRARVSRGRPVSVRRGSCSVRGCGWSKVGPRLVLEWPCGLFVVGQCSLRGWNLSSNLIELHGKRVPSAPRGLGRVVGMLNGL